MTPAYRVECTYALTDGSWNQLSEWHPTLVSAIDAFTDHQQRHWDCVRLIPSSVTHRVLAAGIRYTPTQLALRLGGTP